MVLVTKAAIAEADSAAYMVHEVTLRDPGSHDVVVEIEATPFCYTDWLAVKGDMALDPSLFPVVLGHSAVGRVVDAGRDARVERGTRVVISATPECGACAWCRRGRFDQCAELFAPPPVIGRLADGRAVRAPGAAATYAAHTVIRDIQVWPTTSDLPGEWLAMFGCGIVSGMGAVAEVARIETGCSVVVIGCGQVGLWMIQAAKVLGAETIIAVEPIAARRSLAAQLGATAVIDPAAVDPLEAVHDLTDGLGADYGFDAGGSLESVTSAFRLTRNAGVVVLTSYVRRDSEVGFPLYDLALRGRDVRSSQSGRLNVRRDLARYLPWLADGRVQVEPMLGRVRPLDDMASTLAAARDRTEITPIIVPNGSGRED